MTASPFDRLVGGVNSPVRALRAVGGKPLHIHRAEGCFLWDTEGRRYIDYIGGWGPAILGHADPDVAGAVAEAIPRGWVYGLTHPGEAELAEQICRAFPSIEQLRLVNSGTEAAMSALRLARGYTGRERIVKFDGCYHGHSDGLLARAGSGLATFAHPDSAGVPAAFTSRTVVLPYNDAQAVRELLRREGSEIAAVIVEPIAANMGVVPPQDDFLHTLREETRRSGTLLVFDEVITGFRIGWGGCQERFRTEADLTVLGKIAGGGLPIGAYGGPRRIMQRLSPEGDVYQAGTLSGNPLAVAAGRATLSKLERIRPYPCLEETGTCLAEGLREAAAAAGIPAVVQQVCSMLTLFFTSQPVTDFNRARAARADAFRTFFNAMREQGVLLPPSPFETWFCSTAHTAGVIDQTLRCARKAMEKVLSTPSENVRF
jgi:glutamate-1-semialdehyde 2,1-aminomutase